MKSTAQHREFTDVARRVHQYSQRCLGLSRHLTRFLKENIPQIVFFKIGASGGGTGGRLLHDQSRRGSRYQLRQ